MAQKPTPELEQRLAMLKLEAVRAIDAMSHGEGWKCLSDEMERELRQGIKKIYENTDKENIQKEMSYLKGKCDALIFILSTVNKWKDKEAVVRREVDELLSKNL